MPSHHQHAPRPHKTMGHYSGHVSKSRPGSPTLDGSGSLIAQYHLSSGGSGSASEVSTPSDVPGTLSYMMEGDSKSASRGLHGHLNDILLPSTTAASSLPPVSSLEGSPSHLANYSRVSHTRSAPASRAGSPDVETDSETPTNAISLNKGTSESHLPSLLGGGSNVWGPPGEVSRRSSSTTSWATGFSMTPMGQ